MRHPSLPLTLLLVAAPGCTEPEFPSYSELSESRVLAVRASPPDLVPGDSTTLDALVYAAASTRSLRWSLCPWPSEPNTGFPCPVDETVWNEAWQAAGLGSPPSLELGEGEEVRLAIPDDVIGLRALCRDLTERLEESPVPPPSCEGRWPWTVRLSLNAEGGSRDAVKELPVLLGTNPERNRNPEVIRLEVEPEGTRDRDGATVLSAGQEHTLRVAIDSAQAETYTEPTVAGQDSARVSTTRETLSFSWFTSVGELDRIRGTYREGVESLSTARENRLFAPSTTARGEVYVVVRDDRGGVDFVNVPITFTR